MNYLLLKQLHITTVIITTLLFLIRWYWAITNSSKLHQFWVRFIPHANDVVLFICGSSMVYISHQYPIPQPWLQAKLLTLLIYIPLASIAIKRGRTQQQRLIAGVAALLCLSYILMAAYTHSVTPWRSYF